MSTFAVTNSDQVLDSVNYLLSNLSTGNATGNISVPDGTLVANTATGEITQYNTVGDVYGYVYQYVNLRYATNSSGTTGFSTSPTNATYFGVYNSASPTPSSNPAAYVWREVAGGFGLTKTIYYSAIGGRQVLWAAASSPPSSNYVISVDNVAIDLDVVTTATGSPGERGPIAMAYVVTTADPNTATSSQLTSWFEAPRDNEFPPIGTGLTPPVAGDTATFIYGAGATTPSATASYNGSDWNLVVGQVIAGDVIVANSLPGTSIEAASITGNRIAANTISATNIVTNTITANQIAANTITTTQIAANTITANNISSSYIYAGNIVSFGATLNSNTSPGYWLNYSTGNARFGGNVSIGNSLTIGNNATIGGGLAVSGLVTAGSLIANTVSTQTIVPASVSSGVYRNTLGSNLVVGVNVNTTYYTPTLQPGVGNLITVYNDAATNVQNYLNGISIVTVGANTRSGATNTALVDVGIYYVSTAVPGVYVKVNDTLTQRFTLTGTSLTQQTFTFNFSGFVDASWLGTSNIGHAYVYGVTITDTSGNVTLQSLQMGQNNLTGQLLKR